MKTKILKFGMPLMAFLLAIVFAFAAESKSLIEDDVLITGYIQNTSTCDPVTVDCTTVIGPLCSFGNKQVFRIKNGTECHTSLYKRM